MTKVKTYVISAKDDEDRERETAEQIARFLDKSGVEFDFLDMPAPDFTWAGGFSCYRFNGHEPRRELGQGNFIVFNTSGYRHGLTYFLVKDVEKSGLTYVHLDAHPDFWNYLNGSFSSASFVSPLLDLDNVDYAFLLAITPNETLVPFSKVTKQKIERVRERLRFRLGQDFRSLKEDGNPPWSEVSAGIKKTFPGIKKGMYYEKGSVIRGKPLYLSVDLDVMQDFPTQWRGHGRLDLGLTKKLISRAGESGEVVAGDICGMDCSFDNGPEEWNSLLEVYNSMREVMEARN